MRILCPRCQLSSLISAFGSKLPSAFCNHISRLAVDSIDVGHVAQREGVSSSPSPSHIDEDLVGRFVSILGTCRDPLGLQKGRQVHAQIVVRGVRDSLLGGRILGMYVLCRSFMDAKHVFFSLEMGSSLPWNWMIRGFTMMGCYELALLFYFKMWFGGAYPDKYTFPYVIKSAGCLSALHGLVINFGLDLEASVANTLLALYSKCRCLVDVQKLFGLMPQTDLVTWNGMISGYVQSGLVGEAFELFYQMQVAGFKPDSITLASFLPAFSGSASLKQGKEIHAYIIRNDVSMDAFLKSALIDIYFKCKDALMAKKVFGATGTMDVVICSAMISGYVLNGMSSDALDMFHQLLKAQLKPNPITLASVLPACSCLAALSLGRELHGYILKNAYEGMCYVASALIDMYTKCGRLDLGHQIFTQMPIRDAVAWNSMIASFAQNGQPEDAMSLLHQMGMEGMEYDCVTISSALSACANLPALHYGKAIHGFMTKRDIRSDLFAESALIDMYSKCGNLDLARRVFDSMTEKNEVSWNSVIAAYGAHGLVKDAMDLFRQMQEAGFVPDHITFLALISACGHAGQLDEGFRLFHSMHEQYRIAARMEHYACMVDLYGRAGQLNKALKLIKSMPFKPDAGIWGTVLGACRIHGNVEIAELASKHLFDLDPENSGYYVLLSNIHAVAGRWKGVLKARSLMKERRVQKVPGYSWIVVNNITHMFVAADKSHLDSECIYFILKSLLLVLREEGYVPKPDIIFPLQMDTSEQVLNAWQIDFLFSNYNSQ
ncbi:hypothetical protein GW17_00018716 [Ensete ventricosum]|nr:hypothetical protein GW17_00018716 [Ensete ventricosum]